MTDSTGATGAGDAGDGGAERTSGAGAAFPPYPTGPSPLLTNATREMLKATLVQLEGSPPPTGQALLKSAFVRRLALSAGELEEVRARLRDSGRTQVAGPDTGRNGAVPGGVPEGVFDLLGRGATGFADTDGPAKVPAAPPPASAFAAVPAAALKAVGDALVEVRRAAASAPGADPVRSELAVHAAVVATKALEANSVAPNIGWINLERMEMTPAGIERGELIATIPLAPLEETAVTHKEWSVRTKEFSSIVTDSLENTSETGVTDNTELAQSTSSQAQHSNQFNVTGTVRGGIPVISGSASSSFTAQDSTSRSATESTKHATELTKKASSRAKQEHKVTISTTTVTGSEESSTRTLKNPSQTDAVRIDYFSLMRKWRVRLYRYGLRLTYDLMVPEPGAALRRAFKELEGLRRQIGPFRFDVPHSEITDRILTEQQETQPHHLVLAERYGAVVPDPPAPPSPPQFSVDAPNFDDAHIFTPDPLEIPDGYRIKTLTLWFNSASRTGDEYKYSLEVLGSSYVMVEAFGNHGPIELTSPQWGGFQLHATGKVPVSFRLQNNRHTSLKVVAQLEEVPVGGEPEPGKPPVNTRVRQRWQAAVWNALHDAAQNKYYAQQQDVAARIAVLEERIGNVDTLTLRREESDEVMKGVLRALLGPGFDFMPQKVIDLFVAAGVDLEHGIGFDGNSLGWSAQDWAVFRQHESDVRFLNQAIEWENVVTFLYSYFWDVPPSWDFVRQIQHADANRQAFLRAGCARVVLTVRKGWETEWVRFVEGGFHHQDPPPSEPPALYLSIAQEVAAYDSRNYPGIPPANPARSAVRLEDAVYTTCASPLAPNPADPQGPVTIKVESAAGFQVGATVVIDVADERGLQEAQTVVAVSLDRNQIVVGMLARTHTPSPTAIPVLQPGTKGALIAEWNEYTPSSGTDIAVTSQLGTIA
ncbi:hypothetical protein ACFV0B_18560 [Streptomyces xanthophaeus]|uniref:hypothetical protein n=1 Tax=Streptomyces xanthophaeus TaxID=67385 RepID=UPI00364A0CCC